MSEPTSARYKNENKIHIFVDDKVNEEGMHTLCGKEIKGNGKWEIGYWQITCKECIAKEKKLQPK